MNAIKLSTINLIQGDPLVLSINDSLFDSMYNIGSAISTLGNIYMDVSNSVFSNLSSQMGGAVLQAFEAALDLHYLFSNNAITNCYASSSTVFYIKSVNILTLQNCTITNNYA